MMTPVIKVMMRLLVVTVVMMTPSMVVVAANSALSYPRPRLLQVCIIQTDFDFLLDFLRLSSD